MTCDIKNILRTASDLYYNYGEFYTLTDEEYKYVSDLGYVLESKTIDDKTYDLLAGEFGDKGIVGASVSRDKVALPKVMGSLTELKEGDFTKWIEGFRENPFRITIMEKLDGISCLLEYDSDLCLLHAYTRGDGKYGQCIDRHTVHAYTENRLSIPLNLIVEDEYYFAWTDMLKNMMITDKIYIWGELVIPKRKEQTIKEELLKETGKEFKNLRNTVAGQINSSKCSKCFCEAVDFVAYGIATTATKEGYNDIRHQLMALHNITNIKTVRAYSRPLDKIMCPDIDKVLIKNNDEFKENSDYECDGIVMGLTFYEPKRVYEYWYPSLNYKSITGLDVYDTGTLNPSYMRKFKLTANEEIATTTVEDVEWNPTKTGIWMPRIKIKPVQLKGVTINYTTGFNGKYIVDNGIGKGAVIKIKRAGDVIPHITEIVKPATPSLPAKYRVDENGVHFLINDITQQDKVAFQQLRYFFALEEIEQAKEGNLRVLWDNGYNTIPKILGMTSDEFEKILGANGLKMRQSIKQHIWFPHYVLAGSGVFGSGIGDKIIKQVIDTYGHQVFTTNYEWDTIIEDLTSIKGISYTTALKFQKGLKKAQEFIASLPRNIVLTTDIVLVEPEVPEGLQYNVIFTGVRDSGLEKKIKAKGHNVLSSMSSKVNLVIAKNPDENTTKLKTAREKGIPIISIELARETFGD